jgi:hypothetical protein
MAKSRALDRRSTKTCFSGAKGAGPPTWHAASGSIRLPSREEKGGERDEFLNRFSKAEVERRQRSSDSETSGEKGQAHLPEGSKLFHLLKFLQNHLPKSFFIMPTISVLDPSNENELGAIHTSHHGPHDSYQGTLINPPSYSLFGKLNKHGNYETDSGTFNVTIPDNTQDAWMKKEELWQRWTRKTLKAQTTSSDPEEAKRAKAMLSMMDEDNALFCSKLFPGTVGDSATHIGC